MFSCFGCAKETMSSSALHGHLRSPKNQPPKEPREAVCPAPFLLPSWGHPDPTWEASLRLYSSEQQQAYYPTLLTYLCDLKSTIKTANIGLSYYYWCQLSSYCDDSSEWAGTTHSLYMKVEWNMRREVRISKGNMRGCYARQGSLKICWKTEDEIRKVFSSSLWDFSGLPCDGGSVGTDPSWVISILSPTQLSPRAWKIILTI